jgi:hypothetical protein
MRFPNSHLLASMLILFASSCSDVAAPGPASIPGIIRAVTDDGYEINHSLELRKAGDGIDGFLQIMEDARLTPGIREGMWEGFNDPLMALKGMGVGTTDPLYQSFKRVPVKPAIVRLIDGSTGAVLDQQTLDVPLGNIGSNPVTINPTSYPVIEDHSIGMGSYAGPVARLTTVNTGKLAWAKYVDDDTGEQGEIRLASAIKRGWKTVEISTQPYRVDLLTVATDMVNADGDFAVTYSRYKLRNGIWHRSTRSEPGIWENEGDESIQLEKFPP